MQKMKRSFSILLLLLITACTQPAPPPTLAPTAAVVETAVPTTTQSPIPSLQSPTPSPQPPTPTITALPPTNTPPPTMPPTPTVDPYADLTIDALTARSYGGGEIEIIETLDEEETFTRYLITYPSDGLTVYGYMNVPIEGDNFPVALVLHGYIDPAVYETVAYTRRYADALAEAGYFVIHPNFRNYPPSDPGPNPYRIGYTIDTLNLIAIIREQSQDDFGYLRRADADNIHLWGHSMGGGVALKTVTVNNGEYLKAAVLYGSMSGNERQNFEAIQVWSEGRTGAFELAASDAMLNAISAENYFDRIQTPISIHHSVDDQQVPVAWADDMCAQLQAIEHPVECHTYYATPHTFRGQSDTLFMERVERFFGSN